MFDVRRSDPERTIEERPIGKTRAAVTLCKPGNVSWSNGVPPPSVRNMHPPKERKQPPTKDEIRMVLVDLSPRISLETFVSTA